MEEMFGPAIIEFYWSDSSGPTKGSLHLIVETGKIWRNPAEQRAFWQVIKLFIDEQDLKPDSEYDCLFYMDKTATGLVRKCVIDYGVYSKNRQFRTIYSRKCGSERVLMPLMEGVNSKYFVCCKADENSRFYEIPDNMKSKYKAKQYNSVMSSSSEIEHIIESNIPDVCIVEQTGTLITLKTMGNRKCIINGEENSSDNCYCIIRADGIYFKCHDTGCAGQSVKIHSFESQKILPEYIKDFASFKSLRKIENLNMQHIREFVADNLVYISGNMNGFYMCKTIKYDTEYYEEVRELTDAKFCVKLEDSEDDKPQSLKSLIETLRYDDAKKGIDFIPYNETLEHEKQVSVDEDIFNLFRGFKGCYFNNENYEIDLDFISPVLNHIKEVWCRNVKEQYEYVINWLAHLVQKPKTKTGVALFLKSVKEGAGKDIIWHFMENYVLGKDLVGHMNDVAQLSDKFNYSLCSKILTVCDELPMFAEKSNIDKVKNLITQPVIRMEKKNIDAVVINDYN